MSGEYEKVISIGKAIQNIVSRRYLLLAMQRKFTWRTSQIEVLFDSCAVIPSTRQPTASKPSIAEVDLTARRCAPDRLGSSKSFYEL